MTERRITAKPDDRASAKDVLPSDPELVTLHVRDYYAGVAKQGDAHGCCGSPAAEESRRMGYAREELETLPEGADMGLGCGAPVEHLALRPGEVALDLGSGGGIDVFLAANRVGSTGKVIGVDMTPEMIEKARAAARRAGITNVEFRQGRLEDLPVDDASVDAVTSNCVINLVPDKARVFREIARVLKQGGRLVISDVILNARLPETLERDVLAHGGCISGAMLRENYFAMLRDAGLDDIRILRESDFLAATMQAQPEETRKLEERTGVRFSDLHGAVSSVTYRAVKPA